MLKKVAVIKNQVEEIYDYQIDLNYVEQKLIDLEDRSRRDKRRWYSGNTRGDMRSL